jgi:hypothetical protein
MGIENVRIVDVDHRWLGRPLEQVFRMVDEPLVELVGSGNQHRHRLLAASPGAPDLLPEGRDRAGESAEDGGVEPPDVDAKLEGTGCDHGSDTPGGQFGLDFSALGSEVARSIRAHDVGQLGWKSAGNASRDSLGERPAGAERDDPSSRKHQLGDGANGFGSWRLANAAIDINESWLHKGNVAFGSRRAVVADRGDLLATQLGSQNLGFANGR